MPNMGNSDAGDGTRFFVFMGVCGVGKSTVAKAFADATGGAFVEADALHSPESVQAMASGRPLTDTERWPWLKAVCDRALTFDAAKPVAIACSALRKPYRDFMRTWLGQVVFFHLDGPEALIRARMAQRTDHFMPPAMLESQLAALESPAGEPDCFILDIRQPPDRVLVDAVRIGQRAMARARENASGPHNH